MNNAITDDWNRAQRWHDTEHGESRPEEAQDWVSACFCCCPQCDPDCGHPRPNPYWAQAMKEFRQ